MIKSQSESDDVYLFLLKAKELVQSDSFDRNEWQSTLMEYLKPRVRHG